jgi:molecular chaperone IbpA
MPEADRCHGYRRLSVSLIRRIPMRDEFTPFFRSTIGFDQLFDSLVDRADEAADDYPPYNIAKTGADAYRITLAVAGFAANEIDIVVQENFLSVSAATQSEPAGTLLHRGIANRSFSRRFQLADHVRVSGATLENGLLCIDLTSEVPEAKKPRTVKIESRTPALSAKAA